MSFTTANKNSVSGRSRIHTNPRGFAVSSVVCALILCALPYASSGVAQTARASNEDSDRTIQFSFKQADWKDVIPWFAEQSGYSWQPISDWPSGTFTLKDDRRYTPLEALDQLNYALRLRQPPYTIIRNRNQLILTDASQPLPDELIENVSPEQLDRRGDYEIVSCRFELGDVSVVEVEADLKRLIPDAYQTFAKAFPAANEFHARATGADLKRVRNSIKGMTQRKASKLLSYRLKHYDAEQFLIVARGLLSIPADEYKREDGSLVIVVDPSSGRLIVKGTPSAITDFSNVAEVIDVEVSVEDANVERPYLKSYPVLTDPETARKVIETMLDGTDATVGQNSETGAIVIRGRKEHHDVVAEAIATISGSAGATKIVQLENADAGNILSAVTSLMSPVGESASSNAPQLLANTLQNFIVIHGTPQQIHEVSQMIQQLDQAQQRDPNRIRTTARAIKMNPSKRDELLQSIEDYWPTTGRKNRLRIVMPDENVRDRMPKERLPQGRLQPRRSRSSGGSGSSNRGHGNGSRNGNGDRNSAPPNRGSGSKQPTSVPTVSKSNWFSNPAFGSPLALTTALVSHPSNPAPQTGDPSDSEAGQDRSPQANDDYIPPAEPQSRPGAEITIKSTPFGILIESDDLDALDDLEDIFTQEAGSDSIDQGPTFFYLKHKKATSVKAALDQMFGLDSGSSSSGGGGLLSGIASNIAGEGAGDLLGGLIGGSGDSETAAAIELAGDVQVGIYVPLNLLYVSGATSDDLFLIQDAIDIFDQPTAPQDPELGGQLFMIPVVHRDPELVIEIVRNLMKDSIAQETTAQPQNGQQQNGQQIARAFRQLAGGNRRNGGGGGGGGNNADDESDAPMIRLDLDKEKGLILIRGPEFIYKQVMDIVAAIDTPQSAPKPFEVLASDAFSPAALEIVQAMYGNKIVIENMNEEETAENPAATNNRNSRNQNANNQRGQQNQSDRQRQAAEFFRNLRRGGAFGGQQNGGGNRQRGR